MDDLPSLTEFRDAVHCAGGLTPAHRGTGATLLRSHVFKLVTEPLLTRLLDAFEDVVLPVLRETDPAFTPTDRSLDIEDRVESLPPVARQVIGDLLIGFGAWYLLSGFSGEDITAAEQPDAANHFARKLESLLSHRVVPANSHYCAGNFEPFFGERLHDALEAGIARAAARSINSDES